MAGQRIEIAPYSMFVRTPVYEVNDASLGDAPVVVYGLLTPAVALDASDIIYEIPPAGVFRLDLISNQFYGVPDLWWVIANANGISDPLLSLPAGTRIRIPARERLASEGVLSV